MQSDKPTDPNMTDLKRIFGTANPFSVKVSSATSLVATAVDA